jgi:hypothetical protein
VDEMEKHKQISGFISYRKIRNVQGYTAKLTIIYHTDSGKIKQAFEFKHHKPEMLECLTVDCFEHFAKLFKENNPNDSFSEIHTTKANYRKVKLINNLICWNLI